jgi:hypothetical protein
MKTLTPSERLRSAGNIRRWTALIAVASVSCLPLFSVLADQNTNHGQKGGGNRASSSHQGAPAPHGGGANKTVNVHSEGNHTVSATHNGGNHLVNTPRSDRNRTVSTPKTVNANQNAHHGVSKTAITHRSVVSHHVASRTVTSHQTAARNSVTTKTGHARLTNTQVRKLSPGLRQSSSSDTRTSLYQRNNTASREVRNHQVGANQQHNGAVINRSKSITRETTAYNHSLTVTSVHSMMNRRITDISNRQWTGHSAVFSGHSDPQRGYWYRHGSYWWRGNFWGARAYCDRLIVLGRPPGLCWTWYDDICWGNVVVGMPLELVTYYYPDTVYTSDTNYDGQDATVYYYATADGQYKEVTVVDGEVVDVEIVDQLPS